MTDVEFHKKSPPNLQFNFVYHGDDVDEGSIDVRDLAPSLIALADLVDQSGRIVTPEIQQLTVRVQTGFKRGSFDVGLVISQASGHLVTLFTNGYIQSISNLITILGFYPGVNGLLQVLKKAKGETPKIIEIKKTVEHTQTVQVMYSSGQTDHIPKDAWDLFEDTPTRQAIEKVVAPVKTEGIDELEIKHNNAPVFRVSKNEASFYDAPSPTEETTVTTITTQLVLHSPSFRQGHKWKFLDPPHTLWVSIEDQDFLRKVHSGSESFRSGDILEVTLRIKQWHNEPKSEYTILKVHKHENRLDNPSLPGIEDT